MKIKDCEKEGLAHAWDYPENNIVFPTFPPQYPDQTRKCLNCGKEEVYKTIQHEIKEWRPLS